MSEVLTKAEFAERIGKSRARVSQLVAEGKISGPALVGTGRAAKILVDVALQQLAATLDPIAQLGQGQMPTAAAPTALTGGAIPDAQARYMAARAEREELALRQDRAKEEEAFGRWMLREDAEAEWSREMAAFLQSAETWLVTTAAADVAALESPPLRDIAKTLRAGFRKFRESWSSVMERRAAAAVEDDVDPADEDEDSDE